MDENSASSGEIPESDRFLSVSQAQQGVDVQSVLAANERLKLELDGYKRQYEEAMKYLKQFEDIQAIVADLRKENGKLVAEKDELGRRLDISLMKIEELSNKEKAEPISPAFTVELSDLKQQLQNEKIGNEKKMQEMNLAIQESSELLKAKTRDNEELQSMLNNLVEAAQVRFGVPFTSPTVLHGFLLKPVPEISESQSVSVRSEDSEARNIEKELVMQVKRFKKLAKSEIKARKKMEQACAAIERKSETKVQEAEKIANELEKKICAVQEDVKRKDDVHKRELENKETVIKNLQNELDQARREVQSLKLAQVQKQIKDAAPPPPVVPQGPPPEFTELKEKAQLQAEKLKESMACISSLRKKVTLLTAQVKSLESSKQEVEKTATENAARLEELENVARDLKEKNEQLRIEKDEMDIKLTFNSSRAKAEQMNSSKAKVTIEALTGEVTQLKSAIARTENLFNHQRKELDRYRKERTTTIAIIQKLNSLVQVYDKQCMDMNKEMTEMKKKLQVQRNKPVFKPPPVVEEKKEEVPVNVWTNNELPKSLIDKIKGTVRMNDFPIAHRIQQVMSVIATYYNQVESANEQEKKNAKIEFDNRISMVNKFLAGLGKVVDRCDLSIDALESDPLLSCEIPDTITKLRQANKDLLDQTALQEEKIVALLGKLEVGTIPEAVSQVDQMCKYIACLQTKLKKAAAKNNKLERVQHVMSEEFEAIEAEHKKAVEEHKQQLEMKQAELANEAQKHEEELARVRSEVEQLRNTQTKETEDTEKSSNDEFSRNIERLLIEAQQQKAQISLEMEEHREAAEKAKREADKATKEIAQWRKTAKLLKTAKEAREHQIQQLLKQIAEQEKKSNEKLITDRKTQQAKYEQIISELRTKNASLTKYLDQSANAISECECKIKELSSVNSQLTIEKNQAFVKCEAQRDEMKREKQLIDTKLKAIELSSQIQIQSLTEQQNSKVELAKHEAFSMVANAFKRFFDPRNQLDEEYVQSLLERASSELDRLLKQDTDIRRIIGISNTDSIQDAIAKILMSAYHPQ